MVKGFRLIASLPLQIFHHFSFSLVRNTLRTPFSLARAKLRTPFRWPAPFCALLSPRSSLLSSHSLPLFALLSPLSRPSLSPTKLSMGMRLGIDAFQPSDAVVRVALRGLQRCVTHQLLNLAQVGIGI